MNKDIVRLINYIVIRIKLSKLVNTYHEDFCAWDNSSGLDMCGCLSNIGGVRINWRNFPLNNSIDVRSVQKLHIESIIGQLPKIY